MNEINKKITSVGKAFVGDLKELANKYFGLYREQTSAEIEHKEIPESSSIEAVAKDYNALFGEYSTSNLTDTDVNQGFMNMPGF